MDTEDEEKESRTFWLSLVSAVGVLAILGIILYLSRISDQNSDQMTSPGAQPGIGGGPPNTASPTPSPSPSETPTISPQSYSL